MIRTWHIGHPKRDMLSDQVNETRATAYGSGMGYVLRKHSKHLLAAGFVVYDLVRSIAVSIKGDLRAASLCRNHARGIMDGYFAGPRPGRTLAVVIVVVLQKVSEPE